MIFSKWNPEKCRNDIIAIKCAKRGNDVYCSRVEGRFRGLVRMSQDLVLARALIK